ncbi:manganese-binding lipoprotein MntA [Roseibium sp. TrichSKD4]|nr:manganese-binding lipoprotein MntA [Roseibium sp. TrichSKD4]
MSRMLTLAAAVSAITLFPATLATANAENLKVVASFSIIGDFAKNVGGDRVDITTLVGPNGDAHVYEPRPSDAAAVAGADVVLVNGLQFEGFLDRLVEASGTKAPIVEVTKGGEILPSEDDDHDHEAGHKDGEEHEHDHDHASEEGHDHDKEEEHAHGEHDDHDHDKEEEHAHADEHDHHDHGEFDPHAWQSVHNAEVYVKNIADALCAADAAGCDVYMANAKAFGEELEALEGSIKAAIAEIPEDKRTIITPHDAFRYYEHEYGVKILALKACRRSPKPRLPMSLRSFGRSRKIRLRRSSWKTSPIPGSSNRLPTKRA